MDYENLSYDVKRKILYLNFYMYNLKESEIVDVDWGVPNIVSLLLIIFFNPLTPKIAYFEVIYQA